MNKKILAGLAVAGLVSSFGTSAMALDSYLTDVDSTYQASYRANPAVKCSICHSTAGGGTDKGVTLYANQYRATHSAASIKANDADGDGFTNGQEGSLTADLNSKTVNPFTIKSAAVTGADTALTNVVVLGDNAAAQAAFVAADGGITVATGSTILDAIKVNINNANSTLIFKAGGIDSTAKVYVVDTLAKTNILLTAATEWVANPDGSMTIQALPAGSTFPVDIVVEKASAAAAPVSTNGTASVTGCVTSSLSTPLMMVFSLLSLGFFVRRKKVSHDVAS
jgi:hypothetical protein